MQTAAQTVAPLLARARELHEANANGEGVPRR